MDDALVSADGARLRLERLDEQRMVVSSPSPSPPGSLLTMECAAGSFAVKVQSCRKQADGSFLVQGRPVNLSRQVRQTLLAATR